VVLLIEETAKRAHDSLQTGKREVSGPMTAQNDGLVEILESRT